MHADNPPRIKWLLHCHINHHITNDGAEVDGGAG
jgi:FtsP/CotA-like multicopper oxidase with cupredoxin domain